jgi:superfamily II DNA or RNA helicase
MIVTINPLLKIEVYSHFFKVINPTDRIITLILRFCGNYVITEFVKEKDKQGRYRPVRVFASRSKDNMEYRFHIGQLPEFINLLNREFVTVDQYTMTYVDLYTPKSIDVELKPHFVLRDKQPEVVDFITAEDSNDNRSRLVGLQTGKGKTLCALASISRIKTRTLIVILPAYMEKWGGDVTNVLDISPKDIMLVRGSSQLKGLIDIGLEETITAKFIIISLTTIQNFFKAYEEDRINIDTLGYNCNPDKLCEVLKIGNLIIDETHQHLHAVFKLLLYSHVPKVIALSATLLSDNPTITMIQKLMFPKEIRFDSGELDKYIKVYSIAYQFGSENRKKIRTTEFGSKNYSHNAFEKSIMGNRNLLTEYLKLVYYTVELAYMKDYLAGDKLIIFAASKALCTIISEELKKRYTHLDVRRYIDEDPYENVIVSDIRVTTILSAGTALDIEGLRSVIMTTSISSSVSNIQTLGRLRKLNDRDVKFYYLYSMDVPKHVDYHRQKLDLFYDRVASIKEFTYPHIL